MAFEEIGRDLAQNVASLGFDLDADRQKKLVLDYVRIERSEIEETGEYDLEGLFVRLGYAIDAIGAKRVVLDTIEALFAGLANEASCARSCAGSSRGSRTRRHRRHHRRARRRHYPPRPGRIRLRLRDLPGPPGHRADLHAPACASSSTAARRTAPTIPLPDRRTGISVLPITSLGLSMAPRLSGSRRHRAARRDAGRQRLSTAAAASWSPARRARQDQPGRRICQGRLPARRARSLLRLRGIPEQIIRNMRSIGIDLEPWVRKACCTSTPRGPTSTAWRCTWLACTGDRGVSTAHRRHRSHHQPDCRRAQCEVRPC